MVTFWISDGHQTSEMRLANPVAPVDGDTLESFAVAAPIDRLAEAHDSGCRDLIDDRRSYAEANPRTRPVATSRGSRPHEVG